MPPATNDTLISRLVGRLFPRTPDFYALLNEQCDTLTVGTAALVNYMRTGDEMDANEVRAQEHIGDKVKRRNLDILHGAFSTPIDREDIYRAITSIDEVLNYAKTTVREMQTLSLPPNEHTLAMAELLHQGAEALRDGFRVLEKQPLEAEELARAAQKTERLTEKIYRVSLAELLDPKHFAATLTEAHRADAEDISVLLQDLLPARRQAVSLSIAFVIEVMKRREIYRHLSNASDRIVTAGSVLHDIVAKAN